MKKLKPVRLKSAYYIKIEKEINKIFDEIYGEIFKLLKQPIQVLNSDSYLETAILGGRLYYENGVFVGRINSTTTKELKKLGAVYNRKRKGWSLSQASIPANVKSALVIQQDTIAGMGNAVVQHLNNLTEQGVVEYKTLRETYSIVIEKMNKDILKTITIDSEMTPETAKIIADEYTENLSLYIKDFNDNNIIRLRQTVLDNTQKGGRMESLIDGIQKSYNVSQNKAKFLARQETSLLMSKMRETRYKDAGVEKYEWSTSGKSNVRDDHKKLDGKIFSWDNPPVIDTNDIRRGHPGEDFNCYCVAIPIVE